VSYIATIRHHSISRARHIRIDGSMLAAKSAATKEFRDEPIDYEIVIGEDFGNGDVRLVAMRRVDERRWIDLNGSNPL